MTKITVELLRLMPVGMTLTNGDGFAVTRESADSWHSINRNTSIAGDANRVAEHLEFLGGPFCYHTR